MRAARWPSLAGRKPSKKNRSVGSPAMLSAASAAAAPGTVTTTYPASRAARTSLKPGSDSSGVPASDTRAMAFACGEPRQKLGPRDCGVVLVVRRQRGRYAVVVEELAGDPRVLAGDHIGCRQGVQRPQGDIAQVADWGGDDVEPGREPRGAGPAGLPGCPWRDLIRHRRHCSDGARSRQRQRRNSLSFPFG